MREIAINVTLHISELIYDIENKTYLNANASDTGDNYKTVEQLQVDDADEKRNQVLQSIGAAYKKLKKELGRYLNDNTVSVSNRLMDASSDLKLTLHMPGNFNTSAAEEVCSLMHQYVVNRAICEWMQLHKADYTAWSVAADMNLDDLRVALNSKAGRVRRTQTPFQ